ncbi:hypothetical protein NIES4071_03910 [Calothrix sp. NIES-4071]|nr:hypothetical protein NIES4071_03910 [Calothrix sp. NIES-4071]BAZ54737.1 hypothetical protein NIES4105_03900 [Calothrix sp. NIES-4105]
MGKQATSLGDSVAYYIIGKTWDDTPDIFCLFVEGDNEKTDRGLLFLAYQTSFNRRFRILNNLHYQYVKGG